MAVGVGAGGRKLLKVTGLSDLSGIEFVQRKALQVCEHCRGETEDGRGALETWTRLIKSLQQCGYFHV